MFLHVYLQIGHNASLQFSTTASFVRQATPGFISVPNRERNWKLI